MRVNRIDHINLRTPLLDETIGFYVGLLNLRRGEAVSMDQARNAWLYDEENRPIIHINMPNEGDPEYLGTDSGRLHHIAFDCAGYDEQVERLAELGYDYSVNVIAQIGLRQIFLPDPNGVSIELNFRPESEGGGNR